jgi:chorismate synthase
MEILGGPLYGVAGSGESHGPAITTIVFGCPPGLKISRKMIQRYLDRRRPGSSKHGTPRREEDRLILLSGLYQADHERLTAGPQVSAGEEDRTLRVPTYEEGYCSGEPMAAMVLSSSKRSQDYEQFAGPEGEVRPGHTDLVKFHQSRGFVDPRGGGRSSYRSTISDVIAGSIARIFLREHFETVILSSICQVGPLKSTLSLAGHLENLKEPGSGRVSPEAAERLEATLENSEIHALDAAFVKEAAQAIRATRKNGDSLGAAVEVVAVNPPPLVGEPLYQSLKLRVMGSLGGLHAVQSCEIGSGSTAVERRGSENNDPIRRSGYQSNRHGGLLGGVTTGSPLLCRVGFKPTSSISLPQQSVRKNLEEIEFQLKRGRHDPCVGIRAGITLESRLAIELMNAVLVHQSQRLDSKAFELF